jgi:hypothetical protein
MLQHQLLGTVVIMIIPFIFEQAQIAYHTPSFPALPLI